MITRISFGVQYQVEMVILEGTTFVPFVPRHEERKFSAGTARGLDLDMSWCAVDFTGKDVIAVLPGHQIVPEFRWGRFIDLDGRDDTFQDLPRPDVFTFPFVSCQSAQCLLSELAFVILPFSGQPVTKRGKWVAGARSNLIFETQKLVIKRQRGKLHVNDWLKLRFED
ncbi:MAG: hypothetical protein RIK87_29905 [Fuerstiella sp.]